MASDSNPPESSSSEYADNPHMEVDVPTGEIAMKAKLIKTPRCNVPENEEVKSNANESDPDVTAHFSLDKPMSPAMVDKANDDIKCQLMKEVRKLGQKYDRIFALLKDVRGPLSVKKKFVELAINEAQRFKRRSLVRNLEIHLRKMLAYHRRK